MKKKLPKVHWPTKALANRNYIREVSIDGKKTSLFNFRLGYFELYVQQVMRVGNCLTLLSTPPAFSLEMFRNPNLLNDALRFVFWTFNEAFLHSLTDFLRELSPSELESIQVLLKKHPEAFADISEDEPDEELLWCTVKNNSLKADPKFSLMYERDRENRMAVLDISENLLGKMYGEKKKALTDAIPQTDIGLMDMLLPVKGNVKDTLRFMEKTVLAAGFPHNPFHPVTKNRKGANQYGLNAEIAAIVFFFQQRGYFQPEYTFKNIYQAFGKHSTNGSGKEYNLEHFRQDYSFEKYLKLLEVTPNQAI